VIREHLLLGSERYGTLQTGCGRKPVKIRTEYCCGTGIAAREAEYVRLRGIDIMHPCGRCEVAWRKICRDRNQPWIPTARELRDRGSLGPSNDDSPAVQVEMRAAELEAWIAVDCLLVSNALEPMERDGWRTWVDNGDPTPDSEPGWLAAEMYTAGADERPEAWSWYISRPIADQLAETAADDAAADALVERPRCDWHAEHGADDRPTGQRCEAQATHRLVWLDGSGRYSYGCDDHLTLDPDATPVRVERLDEINQPVDGGSGGAP